MQFDVVMIAMYATEDSYGLEAAQSLVQGVIEGPLRLLTDQFGKSSAVDREDSGVNVSIQDMPADAKEGLISDQTNGIRFTILERMGQIEFQHSRDHTPSVRIDLIGSGSKHTTRMADLMAGFAEGDTFEQVIFVVADDVFEDLFGIAIELPHVQDDMVKVNQMVAFKIIGSAAFETGNTLVPAHPVRIGQRGSDSLVEVLPNRCVVHDSLYTSKWFLDLQNVVLTLEEVILGSFVQGVLLEKHVRNLKNGYGRQNRL